MDSKNENDGQDRNFLASMFHDYTEETTLHAVNHIADRKHSTGRR